MGVMSYLLFCQRLGIPGVIKNAQKKSLFLHCLINRPGISALTTAAHMQLIHPNMVYVRRLCVLQLLSRQRYIARTGALCVAF